MFKNVESFLVTSNKQGLYFTNFLLWEGLYCNTDPNGSIFMTQIKSTQL